jgi:hypothetical protein
VFAPAPNCRLSFPGSQRKGAAVDFVARTELGRTLAKQRRYELRYIERIVWVDVELRQAIALVPA